MAVTVDVGYESRLTIRPVNSGDDDAFLYRLYASTRDDLIDGLGPNADPLIWMQYTAQARSYAAEFPNATHDIVMLDSVPVGRLMVERRADRTWLIDIAVIPDLRSRGIGTRLIEDLLAECSSRKVTCSLHVRSTNPAQRLYRRLGFVVTHDDGIYLLMEWADPGT